MTHERLNTLTHLARRRRGPTCGRRHLVNSLFSAADRFYCSQLNIRETWIGARKWHGRYKALKRSRMAHGQSVEMVELLEKITKDWRPHHENP